jgi:phosphatidylinositol glycan class T
MGQILREYAVAELHLTLNTGRWRYDAWGFPENPAVASGAELWVWMAEGGPVRYGCSILYSHEQLTTPQ